MINVWFGGWQPIGRILIVGSIGYVVLVFLLRISGKRTLAQMNSFDFVITVAIGATFGRVMTARSVALAEAATAFVLLITLQFIVAFTQTRAKGFASVVTAAPRLMAYDGRILEASLRRERVTKGEVLAAVRKGGYGDLGQTAAVVMESDGTLTVIGPEGLGDGSALQPVSDPRRAGDAGRSQ